MAYFKKIVFSGGGGGGYATIQMGGAPFPQETTLNFIGSAVTISDDPGNFRTNITFAQSLDDIAGLAPTAGDAIVGNGSHFVLGNASNINANYTPVHYTAVSTDITGNLHGIDNALATIPTNAITALTGDVVATGPGSVAATIQPNVVTNAKLAQAPANTILGNNTGSTANVADLTTAQVTAMLTPFVGDSGAGGVQGLVPAPPTGSYASGDFLNAGGSWVFVDQSKPRSPDFSLVASIPQLVGGGHSENTFVFTHSDGKLYALVSGGGVTGTMEMYDVSDPLLPVLVNSGNYSGSYNITAAVISGSTYAFIPSSGASTVIIVNITNPYSWSTVVTKTITGTAGSVYSAAYSAGYLYCATQHNGLTVLDVGGGLAGGTLTAPVQAYQEGGGVQSFGVAVSGNYVYTTQYTTSVFTTRQIKSWSITGANTPITPSLTQSLQVTTVGEALGITISGNTAFVTVITAGVNSVNLIDITTPSAMSNLSQITPTYAFNSGYVGVASGNFLFIPSGGNVTNGGAIDMYDITTRTAPIKVDTVYSGVASDVFGGIAINGGYIFVGTYGVSAQIGPFDVFTMPNLNPVFGNGLGSTLTLESLTPNTALISSGTNGIISSVTTATELSYVHGATSNIQAQINAIVGGSGITWSVVTVNTAMVKSNGYFANSASTLTFTLPATAAVGDTFQIESMNTGGWIVAQNAGQTIRYGNLTTTTGTGGSLASTSIGDGVWIVCNVANTGFQIVGNPGNINVT